MNNYRGGGGGGGGLSGSRPVTNTTPTTQSNITSTKSVKETPKETVKETPKEVVKETPKETPKDTPKSDMITTTRGIMNNTFKKAKSKFTEGTHSGTAVLQTLKEIIVETTLTVVAGNEHETTIKSIMNNVMKKFRTSFNADQDYEADEVVNLVKNTIVAVTNEVITTNQPQPTTNTSNNTNNTEEDNNPKDNRSDSTPTRSGIERTDSRSITSSENAGIETQRKAAEGRINKNPTEKDADLTDPEVLDYYVKLRDDNNPLSWAIFGYGSSKNKLEVLSSGTGDVNDLKDNIPDQPVYIYFKHVFGDTERSKFIFMTYVPESLNGLQKSRVLGHRGSVESFFKYFHIAWHILDMSELEEETLLKKLLSAGGANYSVQESNKGNFSDYKTKTKQFYNETEKRGDNIVFKNEQSPLSLTPIDISGRPTVAPTTQFLGNTSKDLKK